MRILLSEAVSNWNDRRPEGSLKMTNTRLAGAIDYDKMTDKALKEYLSHYNKGEKYPCPLLVLKEIVLLLEITYEELLGIEKMNRVSLEKIVGFIISYNTDSTIKELHLLINYLKFTRKK